MRLLFSDLIREVIANEQSLDIDTSRGNISETILQDRIIKLKLLAQRFFAKITSEDMRKKMPRVVRAIAGMTREHAKLHCPSAPTSPLIGGFIMLRYIAPALVTPEAFGLLAPDEVPTPRARANLILIAKILQNISNGLTFETTKKEEHMKPLDDFVRAQFKLMELYYQSIADDPLFLSGQLSEPWSDLLQQPFTPEMIQIEKIGLPELFQLHRLIYRFKTKFLAALANKNNPSSPNMTRTTENNNPSTSSSPSPPKTTSSSTSNANVELDTVDINQLLQIMGPPPSIQGINDKPAVASAGATWIYLGRPNKAGNTTFYITVCKIDLNQDPDSLVNQALAFMNSQAPQPSSSSSATPSAASQICLVVDMSWANVYEVKRKFFQSNRFFSSMQDKIPLEMKKRIREIHLVHPSGVNHMMMFLFRTFVSKKFFSKVHEHNKWKTLSDWIELAKIDLPDESKSYITKAYRVTKVNAKGKRQSRIVKFTDNSILNIDPSSGIMKNEKLLDDIEDISLTTEGDQTTIIMNFSAGSAEREAGRRKKSLLGQLGMKDKADLTTRTYICSSKNDAERFMEDVFEAAYRAQRIVDPLEYKVVKVNEVGKHQDRTFKLTCDSLLNLDGNRIRTEISFVGIRQVDCDKNDGRIMWLQLKIEFGPRKIIFEDANQRNAMYVVLNTRILQANGLEDDEAAQMKFETALWRMKESSGGTGAGLARELSATGVSNPGSIRSSSPLSNSGSVSNAGTGSSPSASPASAPSALTPSSSSGNLSVRTTDQHAFVPATPSSSDANGSTGSGLRSSGGSRPPAPLTPTGTSSRAWTGVRPTNRSLSNLASQSTAGPAPTPGPNGLLPHPTTAAPSPPAY